MSHNIGRVVTITPVVIGPNGSMPATSSGVWEYQFTPAPTASGDPPRFVILHLTAMSIPTGSKVEVPLGYDQELYAAASGADVWTRPIDTLAPITVRFVGGPTGGVTLAEYGSGEPYTTSYPDDPARTSTTNADLFLHTNPYKDPAWSTDLRCGGSFDWQNAACASPGSVYEQTARAVGIYVHVDHDEATGQRLLSSCTGTLIDTNLFLLARHCAKDPDELDIRSGSVTFDYQTKCDDSRPDGPGGYQPHFYKVRRVAAAGGSVTSYDPTTGGDWLILELETAPTGITPRHLRPTNPMAGEAVFTVHHPNAAVKKFQAGTLSTASVWGVPGLDSAYGSSGSALFDADGKVLGAALALGEPCSLKYTSARSVLDMLATPPAPPTPFDLMLVLDRSGSMGEPSTSMPAGTKMEEARHAATMFVQLVRVNAGDRLGMVSFSTTASSPVDEPPGQVNPGKKNQLVGPSGKITKLAAGGSTSIGDGIKQAMSVLPAGTGNQRVVLLLTDGMENTAPMVAEKEPLLGDTLVHAIGFGSEGQLDSALLNRIAHGHGGMYTRANDGLELQKFFALAFGNIFEAGTLADPVLTLEAGVDEATAAEFAVCDEDRITAVVGWGAPGDRLEAQLVTPAGVTVTAATATTESDQGLTWWFLKVPLPLGGEREGTWRLRVRRAQAIAGGEFVLRDVASAGTIRYVATVLADGGPRLTPLLSPRKLYTGDSVNPVVALQYANGTAPNGSVTVEVERLDGSLGALVEQARLDGPQIGEEPLGAFAAALRRIEQSSGGRLPIATVSETMTLYDDGHHDDGAMEPDGIWGNPQADLLRYEGTYTFRAAARYGDECKGQRETTWSVHVEPSIDAGASLVSVASRGPGDSGVLRIRPRDRYGSPLGPGRGERFSVSATPGTDVTGPVHDNGDGSYDIPLRMAPGTQPGVVVSQPDRNPVVLTPTPAGGVSRGCLLWIIVVLLVLAVVLATALVLSI